MKNLRVIIQEKDDMTADVIQDSVNSLLSKNNDVESEEFGNSYTDERRLLFKIDGEVEEESINNKVVKILRNNNVSDWSLIWTVDPSKLE